MHACVCVLCCAVTVHIQFGLVCEMSGVVCTVQLNNSG